MRIDNKIFSYIALIGILLGVSCKKQLDVNLHNTNGVTTTNITGKDVFAQALVTTATDLGGLNIIDGTGDYDFAQQWLGYWARTTSFSPSGSQANIETFTLTNSFVNGLWQSHYHNIYDYNFIIKHSSTNSILPGASIVMRAMIFQDLVDMFGNIPYSQAANPDITIRPSYDSALTIYRNLIVTLDSAITILKASQAGVDDKADIMFKGDKTKWVKFANTIKLRILMRQVPKGDQNYVKTQITNITTEGSGFLGVGQDATVNPGFTDAVGQQTPFWTDYGFQVGGISPTQSNLYYVANKTMLDFFAATGDPRVGYLYSKNSVGGYNGNYLGEISTARPPSVLSGIGPGLLQSPSMPALIFSASQSLFLQAEAAERGLISGSDVALYQQAIEESFRYLLVPNPITAADNFIAGSSDPRVKISLSADHLNTILVQKWVALDGQDGLEAWNDYRRTGVPVITNPSFNPGASINVIPKRALYPQSEYDLNPVNVKAQLQTATDIYTGLFWSN